jgi:hypothetical protein
MYEIPTSAYRIRNDNFGTKSGSSKRIEWEDCRDLVLDEGRKKRLFYSTRKKERVIKFINRFQDDVGLTKDQRLTIEETNVDNVICFRLSKFWRKRFRRSLLTALIRAFNDRKGYMRALERSKYFRKSMPALERFMDGHFKMKEPDTFWYDFDGWCDEFNGMKKKKVKKVLT